MAQMIHTSKGLLRISPKINTKLEYSDNDGRSWTQRYSGPTYGEMLELTDNGKEILMQTSKGLYYSTNEGRSWHKRG